MKISIPQQKKTKKSAVHSNTKHKTNQNHQGCPPSSKVRGQWTFKGQGFSSTALCKRNSQGWDSSPKWTMAMDVSSVSAIWPKKKKQMEQREEDLKIRKLKHDIEGQKIKIIEGRIFLSEEKEKERLAVSYQFLLYKLCRILLTFCNF